MPMESFNSALKDPPKSKSDSQKLEDLISGFGSSEDLTGQNINVLKQALFGTQQEFVNRFMQDLAARTGGRVSGARGQNDIAGKFALAQQQGISDILNQEAERKYREKLAQLNAYIQKYGIDKQAYQYMKQIEAERDMASESATGNLLGAAISILPFLLSSNTTDNQLIYDLYPGGETAD